MHGASDPLLILIYTGPPPKPKIVDLKSTTKTLVITWRADTTPTYHNITGFTGVITLLSLSTDASSGGSMGNVHNFNTSADVTTYTLPDFQEDKSYEIKICAVNKNGENCTSMLTDPPTPVPLSRSPSLPPGLIAGIVLIVVVLLCCCLLFLLFLFLCLCWRVEKERIYFPGKRTALE